MFPVDIEHYRCSLHSLETRTIPGLVASDSAWDHVVQQHLLEQLHVAGQAGHQVTGQGSEGSVGWSKDSEGSATSEGICETSLDSKVYQGRGSIVGQFFHKVACLSWLSRTGVASSVTGVSSGVTGVSSGITEVSSVVTWVVFTTFTGIVSAMTSHTTADQKQYCQE